MKLTDAKDLFHLINWTDPHVAIVAPDGFSVHNLEKFLPTPMSIEAKIQTSEIDTFADYVQEFKKDNTRIIADPKDSTFSCSLNYHKPDQPEWADRHRAILILEKDPDFVRWMQKEGKLMGQKEFSDFMADYSKDFHNIGKTELLQLAKNIKVVEESQLNTDYQNGGLDVMFNASSRATFNGLSIPEQFEVALPVYKGLSAYVMPLRVFWIKEGKGVQLKYEFIRLHKITEVAFKDVAKAVIEKTGAKVYGYFRDHE
ncbi:hypothetical protein GCM10027347_59700 [Larkinella harenae]